MRTHVVDVSLSEILVRSLQGADAAEGLRQTLGWQTMAGIVGIVLYGGLFLRWTQLELKESTQERNLPRVLVSLAPPRWEKQGTRLHQCPALGNPTLHPSCEQPRKIAPFPSHLWSSSSWVSWFRDQWILGLQARNSFVTNCTVNKL